MHNGGTKESPRTIENVQGRSEWEALKTGLRIMVQLNTTWGQTMSLSTKDGGNFRSRLGLEPGSRPVLNVIKRNLISYPRPFVNPGSLLEFTINAVAIPILKSTSDNIRAFRVGDIRLAFLKAGRFCRLCNLVGLPRNRLSKSNSRYIN